MITLCTCCKPPQFSYPNLNARMSSLPSCDPGDAEADTTRAKPAHVEFGPNHKLSAAQISSLLRSTSNHLLTDTFKY